VIHGGAEERGMWTKSALQELIENRLAGIRFIAVSNREPYIHQLREGKIECSQPASGMATALDPIMEASGGTWVAHGSGDADRLVVDDRDHLRAPPDDPRYTLRRVWLDKDLEDEYYYGLSNEGLWPLCHIAFHRPTFRQSNWEAYRRANRVFANAVLEEAGNEPAFVFIQDYHLALLPRMLKNSNPSLIVAQFWHIPWPNRETFRVFPWREELLEGMLGNDLLGFHLRYHCANFVDTVDRNIEAMVDADHANVTRGGRMTMVRPSPISIDFEEHNRQAQAVEVEREMEWWIRLIGYRPDRIGIGIDRVDYTKGIPDRLEALDLLLERKPEYRGRLVFIQIGVPSRTNISGYDRLGRELQQQVEKLNAKWRDGRWQPVLFHNQQCGQTRMMGLHRLADFCLVSALHDGMNLVSKEFVASRSDERGALILSRFTGAARELTDALQINPFSPDEVADAMERALSMNEEEQTRRMRRMRAAVDEYNVYRWAGKFLSTLLKIELPERQETDDGYDLMAASLS
jgi:trehalose 6-phosphate synthase